MKRTLILPALFAASSVFAQITIDQSKALAGGITPGDTAGFPITITQPGSYKLTSNLIVPTGSIGIYILADNVTLDLNGYTVRGPVNCTRNGTTRAVSCSQLDPFTPGIDAEGKDVVIRNGTVRGFPGIGVYLLSGSAENLRVSHNAGYGLSCARGSAANVESELNGNTGIILFNGSVTHSIARENGGKGIESVYIQESLAVGNYSYGISGQGVRASLAANNGMGNFSASIKSMGGNLNGTVAW